MIVFSNTTPFIALSSIDQLSLLPNKKVGFHPLLCVLEVCKIKEFIIIRALVNSIALSKFDPGIFFAAVSISLFFAFSHINSKLQKMISGKILLFFGFVSYPLYLIHENMMISGIIKLDNYIPMIPDYLYPLISITFLSITAYIIAKYIEKPVKKLVMILISK